MLLKNEVAYELHPKTRIVDLSGESESRVRRIPYWLRTIRTYVKKEQPDVILSFVARINILVMLACIGVEKRIIVSERNDPMRDGRGIITKVLTGLLYPQCDGIVFQTKRAWSCYSKVIREKGEIIPNPICVNEFADCMDKTKIVTVGRLAEQKNHKLLIRSFKRLLINYPHMELYIYGEGPCRKELEDYIKVLGIDGKVHLPGRIDKIHREIRDAGMFVLSSDYEGLSNALLEAMVMGLPCISTNCAGSDEYIINEINGLLVCVGDELGLEKAMKRFIEDDELRGKCASNARKISGLVGGHEVMEKWRNIISK